MATSKLYVPLSASLEDDPRVLRAGDDAELVLYRALQLAKRIETDGVIDRAQLLRRCPQRLNPKQREAIVEALISAELLRVVDGGLYIAGWLSWNDSNADISERRDKERERKARGGRNGKPPESARNPPGIPPEDERKPVGFQTESGTKSEAKRSEEEQLLNNSSTTPIGLSETDGGGGFLPETEAAIARLAVAEADASPVRIGNLRAWLAKARGTIAVDRGAELEAAVVRLRAAGLFPSPDAVIDAATRYATCTAREPGARSWGKSRADLRDRKSVV